VVTDLSMLHVGKTVVSLKDSPVKIARCVCEHCMCLQLYELFVSWLLNINGVRSIFIALLLFVHQHSRVHL